jgi:hypothetical protein
MERKLAASLDLGRFACEELPFNFRKVELSIVIYHFTQEGGTGRTRDAHTYAFTDMVVAFVEHYHLVLFRSTAELLTAALTEVLYQNLKLFALVFLVLLCRDFGLQSY